MRVILLHLKIYMMTFPGLEIKQHLCLKGSKLRKCKKSCLKKPTVTGCGKKFSQAKKSQLIILSYVLKQQNLVCIGPPLM